MQFPSRRMLKGEPRRRLEAYRKERWQECRLVREVELDRPLRRQRWHRWISHASGIQLFRGWQSYIPSGWRW